EQEMIILLNGPLGIGKSTLAEALMERVENCVMLDGDHVVAVNPSPLDEIEYLHQTLTLLVQHHKQSGYRHFVINHIWRTPAEIDDLRLRLANIKADTDFVCFLLELPLDENIRRIRARQKSRAMSEEDFEMHTVMEERTILSARADEKLGEPFDVSAPPEELVVALLARLGMQSD
ncbi:TPA: Gar/GrdA family gentamicin resistance ATP-binding protein, partial [Escherichia coli]